MRPTDVESSYTGGHDYAKYLAQRFVRARDDLLLPLLVLLLLLHHGDALLL
jgi:hypothetical protein